MTGARFCFTEMKREGVRKGAAKTNGGGFCTGTRVLRYLKRKKERVILKTDIPETLLLWPRMNQTLYISVTGLSRVILAPLMHCPA